jgi:hypothetical protein
MKLHAFAQSQLVVNVTWHGYVTILGIFNVEGSTHFNIDNGNCVSSRHFLGPNSIAQMRKGHYYYSGHFSVMSFMDSQQQLHGNETET